MRRNDGIMNDKQRDENRPRRGRPLGSKNKTKRKPDPEISKRNKVIAEARCEGCTLQAIGDHFGMTRERVRQICEKKGAAPQITPGKERRRRAVELWNRGFEIPQIADALAISKKHTRYLLIQEGVIEKQVHYRILTESEGRELRRLHEAGKSAYALANEFKCSVHSVKKHILRAGGKMRSPREAQRLQRRNNSRRGK